MSWVFPEILVPLLIALLLGFLIGWLVFKWRRRTLHAHEWNQLTANAQQAQADAAAVRAAYEESNNERNILADQAATLRTDLDAARSDNEASLAQVGTISHQLSEQHDEAARAVERRLALEAELTAAHEAVKQSDEALQASRVALEQSAASSSGEVARLTAELADSQRRFAEFENSSAASGDVTRELDAVNAKVAEQDRTIAQHKLEIKEHTRALEERDAEVTRLTSEMAIRTDQIADLESGATATALASSHVADADARSAELEAALAAARTELDVSQSRLADFDVRLSTTRADLDAAHARVSELEARAIDNDHAQSTNPENAGAAQDNGAAIIGQLRVDLAERDRRIAALEASATSTPAAAGISHHTAEIEQELPVEADIDISEAPDPSNADVMAGADPIVALSDAAAGTADVVDIADPPQTAVGTAGARHQDDLKVIHGIGPRMEELLNSLGISSWEQLADLEASEVAVVDDALEEFPGRIERDQWVEQARDLIARFPISGERPTSRTFLNRSRHDDPQH